MSCVFPTPNEVPYQVKQRVMQYVFPKKRSLIKRASLIKTFSVYWLFMGIVIIFSLLYLKDYLYFTEEPTDKVLVVDKEIASNKVNDLSEISIYQQNISTEDSMSSEETNIKEIIIKSEDIDNLEMTLLETEDLLNELEALI